MAEDKDDIERYRDGSLSEKERHVLEKKALNDPFLADALEGSEQIPASAFSSDLKSIREKVSVKPSIPWFTPLRIAAGIFLVIGVGSLIYILNDRESRALSLNEAEESVLPAPTNSISKDSALLSLNRPKDSGADKRAEPQSKARSKGKAEEKALAMDSKTGPVPKEKAEAEGVVSKALTEEKISEIKADDLESKETKAEVTVAPTQALSQASGASRKKVTNAFGEASKDAANSGLQNVIGNVMTEDGTPLPGVNVQVKGTQTGTTTDSKGNFSLNVPDKKQSLVFSFIGMQSSEVSPHDKTNLNIQLREDVSQLSEVVVKGESLSDLDDPIIKMAAPLGGLKAYNKYLEDNLRYPQQALDNKVKGRVTISFTVSTTGSLSDFTVVKGIGSGCDEEVMRLVKDGPRWTPTTQDDVAIESEVKVKMKFDPEKAKK